MGHNLLLRRFVIEKKRITGLSFGQSELSLLGRAVAKLIVLCIDIVQSFRTNVGVLTTELYRPPTFSTRLTLLHVAHKIRNRFTNHYH